MDTPRHRITGNISVLDSRKKAKPPLPSQVKQVLTVLHKVKNIYAHAVFTYLIYFFWFLLKYLFIVLLSLPALLII